MSDNDVIGSAVKVRKILAPDAKQKAQAKARQAKQDAEQYKQAAKANVDAIKAVNARARKAPTTGGANGQKGLNDPASLSLLRAAAQQKKNLRGQPSAKKPSDPRQRAAAGQAAANPSEPRKTQAELAREKLQVATRKAALHQQAARKQQQATQLPPEEIVKKRFAQMHRAQVHMEAERAAAAAEAEANKKSSQKTQSNQLVHVPQPAPDPGATLGREKSARPIINATALLAAKYPNYFADNNDSRTKAESRVVFIVASLILSIIAMGWINWQAINFQASGDFTYNSGLIGGIMMACVLLYALRKRIKILRKAGNMEVWYYFHLLGGVLGPLIIVFHTGFDIKSINSGVALFTMITIVLSGVFGRYIYTRIGYSLHRKLLAIKEAETRLLDTLHGYESPLSDKIERRLSNFALSVLTGPRSILKLPMRMVAIRGAATACYVKVNGDLSSIIKTRASREGWSGQETRARIYRDKELLRTHINSVAEIAHAHLFERVLVKWRILHIPLLYILVITSLFHVLAVHMY